MLWQPKNIGMTNMDKFREMVNRTCGLDLGKLVCDADILYFFPLASSFIGLLLVELTWWLYVM